MAKPLNHNGTRVAMAVLMVCLGSFLQPSLAEESPWIGDGSKVTLLYQITVPGDERFEVRDLSQFVQGEHQMLPALERAVTGMRRGDKTEVKLNEEQAFGPYDAKKKKIVATSELPAGTKPGDVLEDRNTGMQATVTQLSNTEAVMDYNHPLAGKPLVVQLTILDVDNPS